MLERLFENILWAKKGLSLNEKGEKIIFQSTPETPLHPYAGTIIYHMEIYNFMDQLLNKDVEFLYFIDPVDGENKYTLLSKEGIKFKKYYKDILKRIYRPNSNNNKLLIKCINKIYRYPYPSASDGSCHYLHRQVRQLLQQVSHYVGTCLPILIGR